MTELIPIGQIKQDAATQPRVNMHMAVVDEYSESMKAGGKFPPLEVFRVDGEYVLVDGYHRLLAAQSSGIKKVLCNIHEGKMRDAILFASGVNATHGLRRTNEDKRRAVERLLNDKEWSKWSDNKIAEVCNVHPETVSKYRSHYRKSGSEDSEPPTKTRTYATKHGTVSRMKTDKIGKKDPEPAKPEHFFAPLHDGEPVDPPKTVTQIDQEQARRQEIAEAAKNQPAFTTATTLPPAPDFTPPCKAGKPCPGPTDLLVKQQVLGNKCAGSGNLIVNQKECPVLRRQYLASPEGQAAVASARLDGAKIIRPGGIRIVKTPMTCEELNKCADDLIERSGFFTEKEVRMVDELIQARYEGIRTRADFLKKAANWFLTSAGEDE